MTELKSVAIKKEVDLSRSVSFFNTEIKSVQN